MPAVLASGMADIVALCDLDSKRTADGSALVDTLYRAHDAAPPATSVYGDYRELLARSDVDAVVISTPDHWHAELALAAARAGKDIYLQKPFTMTLAEGILLREAVAKHGRILQVGSQQRSTTQFRRACELVRSGRVGRLRRVEIGLPIDPTKLDDPEQPVPANLDYDRWLGCTAREYYTEQRVHPQRDYSRPGWLRNEAYSLGMITGWGSHHFDTAHWAMDVELGGPTNVEGRAEFPANKIWNVHGAYDVELAYPGDVRVRVCDKLPNGLKFIGDEGWIWVTRAGQTTSSDPAKPGEALPPLDASSPKLLDPAGVEVELPRSEEHHKNWLECVRSRQMPIAPAPVAHRSGSACILSWIAMKLGRPLAWDAKAERFVNDDQANAMLSRPERAPYGATRLATLSASPVREPSRTP
jgi:predicted dehydrogenase